MEKMLAMFHTLNTDRQTPMAASEISTLLCKGRSKEECDTIHKTVEVRANSSCTYPAAIIVSGGRPCRFCKLL